MCFKKFQIESKLQFITSKLEPGTKIHLIGHSFGAYIALKLFEKGRKHWSLTSNHDCASMVKQVLLFIT